MSTVISADRTSIGYDKTGSGPALVLVDGAFCSRQFGPMPDLPPEDQNAQNAAAAAGAGSGGGDWSVTGDLANAGLDMGADALVGGAAEVVSGAADAVGGAIGEGIGGCLSGCSMMILVALGLLGAAAAAWAW